ncbi:hypothetical protein [Dielma fastidiosa]|uniref:Uncharacterized protein n=1 Tax=Dielma fastidiosa TaxID=1034346 RepID=A0A318KXZ2_9FIRM|nr:hypothetical protein [Dielma fastidiosa]PXX80605.1 hypothetical protein DES51_103201 [Dielma fastidiosa]
MKITQNFDFIPHDDEAIEWIKEFIDKRWYDCKENNNISIQVDIKFVEEQENNKAS